MSSPQTPKKAIVIGASSGIGRALVKELVTRGFEVGMTARRKGMLEDLQQEAHGKTHPHFMDVNDPEEAVEIFDELIREMGGVDLVIINAGVNFPNFGLAWPPEHDTLQTNVVGFTAIAGAAARYFISRNQGYLAAVSSIAALRGSGRSPAYSASKAFVSNYLDGLRQRLSRTPISVTDIRPGFVATEMIGHRKELFWVATCEKAAKQICDAVLSRKKIAYITKRWALIAWFYARIPHWLCNLGYWRVISEDAKLGVKR